LLSAQRHTTQQRHKHPAVVTHLHHTVVGCVVCCQVGPDNVLQGVLGARNVTAAVGQQHSAAVAAEEHLQGQDSTLSVVSFSHYSLWHNCKDLVCDMAA
jgi:hypothetical protein